MLKYFFTMFLFIPVLINAQGTMKLSSGTNIVTSSTAFVVLQDMHLTTDGTINQTTNNGTYKFTGTLNSNINGASNPLFDVLEVAKTGSAVVSLQRAVNIGSSLKFTSGLLNLNNNNIILSSAGLINGETESSRLTGTNGGYIQITSTLNAPNAVNPGNLGAVITSAQNLGNTVIRRGHAAQTDVATPNFSINRYFDISPATNTNLNATLRINYFDAELNGKTETALNIWKSTDNTNWTITNFSSKSNTSNFMEASGVNSFARFTLSDKIITGIFDLPGGRNSLTVFPNPYAATLTIQIESTKSTKATIQLFDMLGQLVYVKPISILQGKNTLPLQLKMMAKGIYQLKIIGEEGSVAVIPVMKE
jgi:hypothetical protein